MLFSQVLTLQFAAEAPILKAILLNRVTTLKKSSSSNCYCSAINLKELTDLR